MKWKIGNIELSNQIVLAPMAGISNPAYIKICEKMGLGYAVTELISAEAIVRDNKKTFDMLNGIDHLNIPIAIQIFGSNSDTMAKAAKIITDLYKNVFIDINMGCPVCKVALRAQAGSALLKDPKKVYEIVKAVVGAVSCPVTVKIRSGWDQNHINAVEIAQMAEKGGASAITVHGRTRSQGYTGSADWKIIRKVKENVCIPVIGNGDIKSCYDAKKMLEETNCDGVMIGRACIGNPWIIKDCIDYLMNSKKPISISLEERIEVMKEHLTNLITLQKEKTAILEMRMHIGHYLKGIKCANECKKKLMTIKEKQEWLQVIDQFLQQFHENN